MEERTIKKMRMTRSPEDDDTGQSCKDFDVNVYLTYDIVRLIFQYLRGRELSNAAMVCRSWLEAATKEHNMRKSVCFIGDYSIRSQVVHQIRDLYIKPRIGILFTPRITENLEGHIDKVLPSDCEIVVLHATGIIINNEEMENYPNPKVVCTFLPKIPNVNINTFQIVLLSNTKAAAKELEKIMICLPNSNDETSVCLMLFCNCAGRQVANFLVSTINKRHGSKINSVWGGVTDVSYMQNRFWEMPHCIAVFISGALKTWSTILDLHCNTKELIEKKLKTFKDQIKLKKHSIGFMFACTARGINMHKKENVESTIFKRLFPNVPLVGCFGDGEFGKNTMNVDDAKKETSTNKGRNSKYISCNDLWYYEFSTVFMILTYG